jgi:uncharacterized protein (TIGR03905 family)
LKTTYYTQGTCARRIDLEVEAGIIKSVQFFDGCDGNLQGLTRLVENAGARATIERLRGIRCGRRPTSCPDQLARALEENLARGE